MRLLAVIVLCAVACTNRRPAPDSGEATATWLRQLGLAWESSYEDARVITGLACQRRDVLDNTLTTHVVATCVAVTCFAIDGAMPPDVPLSDALSAEVRVRYRPDAPSRCYRCTPARTAAAR